MIKYIHPYDGSNKNPGTKTKPWKDLSNLKSRPWNEALIARDTELHVTENTRIFKTSNKHIGTYGSGANPLISNYRLAEKWKQVLPDIWEFKISKVWSPVTFLCFGQLGSYGKRVPYFHIGGGQKRTLPSADKEWDTVSDPKKPSVLYVYAPEHPVRYYSTIYYQTARDPVFQIANSDNISIEEISYRYASNGVKITCNDGKIHKGCKIINNTATDVAQLASIVALSGWIDRFEVRGCIVEKVHNNGIFLSKYLSNGLILNNQFKTTGLVESAGGIYVGDCFAPVDQDLVIKGNRVEDVRYSGFWPLDGAGIYTDSDCQNIQVTQNGIFRSHVAMKSNSGKPGLRFFENITSNCDIGFEEGDSDRYDAADTRVYYNNFLNCQLNAHYPKDPINRELAAIRYFNQHQKKANYQFYSNEITGHGGKGMATRKPVKNINNRFIGFDT